VAEIHAGDMRLSVAKEWEMLVPFLQAILNFAYGSIDAGGVVIDGLTGISSE